MKRILTGAIALLFTASGAAGQSGTQGSTSSSAAANAAVARQGKQVEAKAAGQAAGGASAQAGQNSGQLASGTTIDAALTKTLDAKKNKPGDEVTAKVTKDVKADGQVVLPKNTKLIGRVTEAQAKVKGESESRLGILFEKAVLKDGREIPVQLVVQAVAAAQTAAVASAEPVGVMGSGSAAGTGRASGGSGGLVGTAGSTASAATGAVANTAGTATTAAGGTLSATTRTAGSAGGSLGLNSASQGVIGIPGVGLVATDASSSTQGAVLVSSERNVRLESGTRMMLRVSSAQ